MLIKAIFNFTTDNEAAAIEEIGLAISSAGYETEGEIAVIESTRACRNAHGKRISEDKFDGLQVETEEGWFDDYDFVLEAKIKVPENSILEEVLDEIEYISKIKEIF